MLHERQLDVLRIIRLGKTRNCEISEILDMDRTIVAHHLKKLFEKGYLAKYGSNWYPIEHAPAGAETRPGYMRDENKIYLSEYHGNYDEKMTAVMIDILKREERVMSSAQLRDRILDDVVRDGKNGHKLKVKRVPTSTKITALMRKAHKTNSMINIKREYGDRGRYFWYWGHDKIEDWREHRDEIREILLDVMKPGKEYITMFLAHRVKQRLDGLYISKTGVASILARTDGVCKIPGGPGRYTKWFIPVEKEK